MNLGGWVSFCWVFGRKVSCSLVGFIWWRCLTPNSGFGSKTSVTRAFFMPPKWRKVALSIIPKTGGERMLFLQPIFSDVLVRHHGLYSNWVVFWIWVDRLYFFLDWPKKPLRFIALPQNQDTVKGTGCTQLLSWIGRGGCVFSSINILGQSASCLLPTPKQGEALKGVFVPQFVDVWNNQQYQLGFRLRSLPRSSAPTGHSLRVIRMHLLVLWSDEETWKQMQSFQPLYR